MIITSLLPQVVVDSSASGSGKLRAAFSSVSYEVFRVVAAFAHRMSTLDSTTREAIRTLNLSAMAKSIVAAKVR